MSEAKQVARPPASWATCPKEIRDKILDELLNSGGTIAGYAAVSREWQDFVERINFRRITIRMSKFSTFTRIMPRRTHLVEYILFYIDLLDYKCDDCRPRTTPEYYHLIAPSVMLNIKRYAETNNDNSYAALGALFQVLARWKPSPCGTLVLDISAHSPGDVAHSKVGQIYFGQDTIPNEPNYELEMGGAWHNRGHRSCLSGAEHMFGSQIKIPQTYDIPQIPVVTTLQIRRQSRRQWIRVDGLGDLLSKRFPRLETIYLEPWREWSRGAQVTADEYYCKHLRKMFHERSSHLKRLVIFEDFNDEFVAALQGPGNPIFPNPDPEPRRIPTAPVSEELARLSIMLQSLSASFMTDATLFFEVAKAYPLWKWNKLESLALTSGLLVEAQSPKEINALFQRAAVEVLKMPKLNTLELWNGGVGHACVFRYQFSEASRTATLTWRATWNLALESNVIQAWEDVAQKRGQTFLRFEVVRKAMRSSRKIKSHGDAIRHLKLVNEVVHPASLFQIRREVGHTHHDWGQAEEVFHEPGDSEWEDISDADGDWDDHNEEEEDGDENEEDEDEGDEDDEWEDGGYEEPEYHEHQEYEEPEYADDDTPYDPEAEIRFMQEALRPLMLAGYLDGHFAPFN